MSTLVAPSLVFALHASSIENPMTFAWMLRIVHVAHRRNSIDDGFALLPWVSFAQCHMLLPCLRTTCFVFPRTHHVWRTTSKRWTTPAVPQSYRVRIDTLSQKVSNAYRYSIFRCHRYFFPEDIDFTSIFHSSHAIDIPFEKVSIMIRYLPSKVSINPASVVGLAIAARVSTTSASHTLPRCTTMVERRKNDDGGRDAPVSLGVRASDRTCDDQVDANEHQG